uniref:Uncharacterized protein n=1 Tax=Anguilla anguilla TaxID=7936 RepID=A0A0E9S4Y6_ANGAN
MTDNCSLSHLTFDELKNSSVLRSKARINNYHCN